MVNMNYFFNVSYFEPLQTVRDFNGISSINFADQNNTLFNYQFPANSSATDEPGFDSFSLFTTYPGLLIGTGYPHDFKGENTDRDVSGQDGADSKEQPVKVGFSFDYVTGLPVIPGSSVKGLLRSYFPDPDKKKQKNKEALKELIPALIRKENLDVTAFLKNIFDNGDVFLDAIPVIAAEQGPILAEDYITPHKDPLKGPTAIHIMKVKPNVQYRFRFILHDFKPEDSDQIIVTKEEKLELFKTLILLGGAGAKTNVGFGQFADKRPSQQQPIQNNRTNQMTTNQPSNTRPSQQQTATPIRAHDRLIVPCRGLNPKGTFVQFTLPTGQRASCPANGANFKKGDRYQIEITKEQPPFTVNGTTYINFDCKIIGKVE